MKKIIISALVFFISTGVFAQQSMPLNLKVRTTRSIPSFGFQAGCNLTLTSIICDTSNPKGYNYIIMAKDDNGKEITLDFSQLKDAPVTCVPENKDEYWYIKSIQKTLVSLSNMRNAYELRNKAENSANQYINTLRSNALILDDPFLVSYLNSLLVRINPTQRLDFFKYNTKVIVVKSEEPNAGIYPNGSLLINAGMLARVHTEDELVALLCHEANHFICNHYLDNMAKIQKRETAGAIGSAILGAAAGFMTGSASLGISAADLALEVGKQLNKMITAMGLAFNQTQEKECDKAAVELLPLLGYDVNGMATCIKAIGDYYMEEGNLAAYYKSGSHPKIEDRIAATGVPYERRDSTFEKKMAPCVSYVANELYGKGRYTQAMEYVNRNITNHVGRGMDYYIKGECLLATEDTEESNLEAKESLLVAKESYFNKSAAIKALVIADVRLGSKDEAVELLNELISMKSISEADLTWGQSMLQNLAF